MKIKAQLMFDPMFGNAVNKIWSATDIPLVVKLAVADFKKKMTEVATPINEEVNSIRAKYIDKTTGQIPEDLHEEFNKEWEKGIANVDLDFGSMLPLPLGYDPMKWESMLLKWMSSDEINILDSHWIIDIEALKSEMKMALV